MWPCSATSVRKFLKKLGVTAQREIETAVREAAATGRIKDSDRLPAKAVVTVGGINLAFEIDATLADPKLYDRDPARVAALGKERADAASELARAEDQWLALSGEYEEAVGE